jgi:hypothetical protein
VIELLADIGPQDVYARVARLEWLVRLLAVLVVLQIVVKVLILTRAVRVLNEATKLLRYSEMHASVSDSQRERIASTLTRSTEEVKQEIGSVPGKAAEMTVEKLKGLGPDDSHQGAGV